MSDIQGGPAVRAGGLWLGHQLRMLAETDLNFRGHHSIAARVPCALKLSNSNDLALRVLAQAKQLEKQGGQQAGLGGSASFGDVLVSLTQSSERMASRVNPSATEW